MPSEDRPFCPFCQDDDTKIINECFVLDVAGNTCHLAKCLCGRCGRTFTVLMRSISFEQWTKNVRAVLDSMRTVH